MGARQPQASAERSRAPQSHAGVLGILDAATDQAIASGLGAELEEPHDRRFRAQIGEGLVDATSTQGSVVKVEGGWRYKDGSEWPTLNALRDHLLRVSRQTVASDRLVRALREPAA